MLVDADDASATIVKELPGDRTLQFAYRLGRGEQAVDDHEQWAANSDNVAASGDISVVCFLLELTNMQLLPGETVLLEAKPSANVAITWLFSKALPIGFYAGLLLLVSWIFFNSPPERGKPPPYSFLVGALVVVGGFLVAWGIAHLYCRQLAQSFKYLVTSQRFIFSGGIARRVLHAVEHRRVTDVQLSQNPIEQLAKLSSVSLFTPGTASVRPNSKNQPMPELRLEGLPNGEEVFALVSACVQKAKPSEP